MINPNVKFTITDYTLVSKSETDRYELIDGDLMMTPSPSVWHQNVSDNLLTALKQFVRLHNLGRVYSAPLDVILSNENVLSA